MLSSGEISRRSYVQNERLQKIESNLNARGRKPHRDIHITRYGNGLVEVNGAQQYSHAKLIPTVRQFMDLRPYSKIETIHIKNGMDGDKSPIEDKCVLKSSGARDTCLATAVHTKPSFPHGDGGRNYPRLFPYASTAPQDATNMPSRRLPQGRRSPKRPKTLPRRHETPSKTAKTAQDAPETPSRSSQEGKNPSEDKLQYK